MAGRVRKLVEKADSGELTLVVFPIIVAEVFYTLESFYDIERNLVAEKLAAFLKGRGIEVVERERIFETLKRCREQNAHFADSYLAAAAIELSEPVASFDRDFDKFKGVRRIQP